MCGILAAFNMEKRITFNIIRQLSVRGRDGYGIWTKNGIVRSTKNVADDYPTFAKQKLILANSRAIPTTEVESGAGVGIENQQPFTNNRYVVVHNGIIANDKKLIRKYKLTPPSKVDTAILPELFSKLGVVEGLKKLEGSFAILCYDKKENKLFVAKNFMPLQVVKYNNQFFYVSLKEMVPDFLRAKAREVEPYICKEINLFDINETVVHSLYPKKQNKKVLVICSGGIDSVTTAYVYKHKGYNVKLLHFTYGQAAQKAELFAIKKISKDLKAELIIYDAKPVFNMFKSVSRLLSNKGASKKTQMEDAESTFSYVPNRNAIFAMIAGAVAEMNKCDTVSFGGQQMDSVYPDNNNTFVDGVDNLLKYSLNWNVNVKFTAPLINLIKHEIVEIGKWVGVPYQYVCSCYYPKVEKGKIIPCRECGCCQFRDYAFNMLQMEDSQFPNSKHCKDNYRKIKDLEDSKEFIRKYMEDYM